ncbi:MAG: DNA replication/repair protein RecF [Aeromicrobium sp.]
MHVTRLALHDFRSYAAAEFDLSSGPTAFIGANGQGKTNLVEAIDYVAGLESHRVALDTPLIKAGTQQAVVRVDVQRGDRSARLEVEIASGRANRGRINGAAVPRMRDMIGVLRTVMFSPEDLALVKGDPSDRRRLLDALLTLRTPRMAGVRADYDRVLKQRNTLLKSARARSGHVDLSTLDIWDEKLVALGGEIIAQRRATLGELDPYLIESYRHVAADAASDRQAVSANYRSAVELGDETTVEAVRVRLAEGLEARRRDELDRGVTLVGPHRDDVDLAIGDLPARGYASHGESWSLALALRLASFQLLREDGDDPVLILDDVFAELDGRRRSRLAGLAADVEQVLVTAAVAEDVPDILAGERFNVSAGEVTRA